MLDFPGDFTPSPANPQEKQRFAFYNLHIPAVSLQKNERGRG